MNRPVKLAIAGITLAAVAWLAFGFFGIQAAFIDNEVSEANPFANVVSAPVEVDPAQTDAVSAPAPDTAGESAAALPVDPAPVDPAPAAADETTDDPAPVEPAVPEIVTLATGTIVDHDHQGQGTINVLTDGNQRFLRFEDDFAVDNGPDLNVYLVRGADAEGDPGLFDDDFIDLGDLKGNIGAQNYELDPSIDLDEYDTVVIWCVRFGVAFNAANLS